MEIFKASRSSSWFMSAVIVWICANLYILFSVFVKTGRKDKSKINSSGAGFIEDGPAALDVQ